MCQVLVNFFVAYSLLTTLNFFPFSYYVTKVFVKTERPSSSIEEQNNVIYKIPCGDCQAVYIGKTKRSFGTRYKEHFSAVKNGNVAKYEIAEHSWKYDHRIDWDNKTIIDRESFLIAIHWQIKTT